MAHCDVVMAIKAQNQANRGTCRKVAVVVVLVAIVMAFYVGSFLVLGG